MISFICPICKKEARGANELQFPAFRIAMYTGSGEEFVEFVRWFHKDCFIECSGEEFVELLKKG